METVEKLMSELEDLYHLIVKTYEHFKKSPKALITRGYLDVKLQTLDEYWQQFRSAHTTLLKSVNKEQRNLCEDVAMQAKIYMKDCQFLLTSQPNPNTETPPKDKTVSQVKLPRITLPTFSGSYEDWPTYHDLFTWLVHQSQTISNVQKLHYLKTSVTGEAELLLRHIQVNEANYLQAWETLEKRYNNKRLINTSLLKRLFAQRKMNSQSSNQIKSLLDTTRECLNSLKNLKINTENWDPLIIFLVIQKLDAETHKDWEEYISKQDDNQLPTFETLTKFMESKFRTLELIQHHASTKDKTIKSYHVSDGTNNVCPMCNEEHTLSHCKTFSKLDPVKRGEFVKSKFICFNCLAPGHTVKVCRLTTSCRLCRRRHHTLLHQSKSAEASGPTNDKEEQQPRVLHSNVEDETADEEEPIAVMTSQTSTTARSTAVALLATALVEVKSEDGHTTALRALVDPGSQGCFISERAAQNLKARRYAMKGTIVGVGEAKSRINQVVQIEVLSRSEPFSLCVKAFVISKQLTTLLRTQTIPVSTWSHLQGLVLADPGFNYPTNIDLLLGVNEYAQIIQDDIIKGPPGFPCAQKTTLGWILFGNLEGQPESAESIMVMHHQVEVEDMLKTLWEIDTDTNRRLTKDEERCETIYKDTNTRNNEGRYVVKLPFNTEVPKSPEENTMKIAAKRLETLEKIFERDTELKKNYTEVMQEYIKLKYMEEVPEEEIDNKSAYLPHHAVVRSEKETTKTRVVFDASCKGVNGVSFNDELLSGPVVQKDLRSIIMRRKTHKICFASDIEKMYRMILVNKNYLR